jgi:CheY-like chemotaxis protein
MRSVDINDSIEEFAEQVREVLIHLHDYVRLQSCPLCSVFFPDPSLEGPSRVQRFRRLLLEAIEELSPPDQVPVNSREWRGYHILSSRYIEGHDSREVMLELGIGERQFYREQHRAIEALAQLLWEKYEWIEQHRRNGEPKEFDTEQENEFHILHGEAEQLASRAEKMELKEIIRGVLRAVGPLAKEKGVTISYHLGEHLPAIYANRTLTRQILIHVLSRCIIQPETSGVHAEFGRKRRQMAVEATGFTSLGTRQSTAKALSLDAARHLVEIVGGEWEGVKLGQEYYRIQFLLPTSEPRILLAIEDNPTAIKLLQRYLARQNDEVAGACNGDDALGLAQELQPDVITLDLMMPHQDGWEVLEALNRDPATKGIPILICSVLDEPQVALALGASAYLKKPFTQAQLLDVLSRLCASRNGRTST